MIVELDNKLIATSLFEEFFVCDIATCEGVCCVHGDSGAPLEDEEKDILEAELKKILPHLKPEGRVAIKKQGVSVIDADGDLVTPLINGEECAYSYYTDNGTCFCGIEKAYLEGETMFRKPISCHLYPIRVKNIGENIALNYDQWSICQCARDKGKREKISVYQFLKEPIIRKFGEPFYHQLEELDKEIKANLLNDKKKSANAKKKQ